MLTEIKYLLVFLMLLLSSAVVMSQISTSEMISDCKNVINTIKEPVYSFYVVNWPNSTKETKYNLTGYKDVEYIMTECKQPILIVNDKPLDYTLQGYKCVQDGVFTVCDSVIDGNADGRCAANGGETCCRVKDGVIQCKNSQKDWDKPTGNIQTPKLVAS